MMRKARCRRVRENLSPLGGANHRANGIVAISHFMPGGTSIGREALSLMSP